MSDFPRQMSHIDWPEKFGTFWICVISQSTLMISFQRQLGCWGFAFDIVEKYSNVCNHVCTRCIVKRVYQKFVRNCGKPLHNFVLVWNLLTRCALCDAAYLVTVDSVFKLEFSTTPAMHFLKFQKYEISQFLGRVS